MPKTGTRELMASITLLKLEVNPAKARVVAQRKNIEEITIKRK
jgi:hypothetical protein